MKFKKAKSYDKNKHFWIHNDNKCIGYIKINLLNNVLEINQIYIYPNYRGNQLGKKSIEMIIKEYDNVDEIVLWAYGETGSEMNLYKYYESIGFKKIGKPTVVSVENNDYMKQYMKYYIH
jgi:predicted GNAT family N-acyltransferase